MQASETSRTSSGSGRARIFISYKRNSQPDEDIAMRAFEVLRARHNVFIDQTMLVGTRWAEQIEIELRRADYLLTFLSAQSVLSEMVQGEIELAHRLAKEHSGRPIILPVRLNYREAFNYPLSAYLNQINWAFWGGSEDTDQLMRELSLAIGGEELSIRETDKSQLLTTSKSNALPQPLPLAQPVLLDLPEGTMDAESHFYVERQSDKVAFNTMAKRGQTLVIKGPRQMGKSSLLIRAMAEAANQGKRIAFLDFQLFDKAAVMNGDIFFRRFCSCLSEVLELDDQVEEYWELPLGNVYHCTRYVKGHILRQVDEPLVLAMDEVDSLFEAEFRSEFFGMLRAWHGSRARDPLWRNLDLALVTSTEPYQLIENLNQSPFNVGEVIELADFNQSQIRDLNKRHSSPLNPEDESKLMNLLNGHPYLVRRALYLVASERLTATELFARATDDRGPFGDHLRYHLFRLHDKKKLIQALQQIIRTNNCPDELIFFRLQGAGLVRRDGRKIVPRCSLYADYFREHLHV